MLPLARRILHHPMSSFRTRGTRGREGLEDVAAVVVGLVRVGGGWGRNITGVCNFTQYKYEKFLYVFD